MPFQIEEKRHARDITVIRLTGEIDSEAVRELRRRLRTVGEGQGILVDLTGVEFIDPTVLGWLVTAVMRLRSRSGRLVVLCPDPAKRQIFELIGLDRVFSVEATFTAALRELEDGDPAPD